MSAARPHHAVFDQLISSSARRSLPRHLSGVVAVVEVVVLLLSQRTRALRYTIPVSQSVSLFVDRSRHLEVLNEKEVAFTT